MKEYQQDRQNRQDLNGYYILVDTSLRALLFFEYLSCIFFYYLSICIISFQHTYGNLQY